MDQAFVLESLQELVPAASAPLKLLQKRALSHTHSHTHSLSLLLLLLL